MTRSDFSKDLEPSRAEKKSPYLVGGRADDLRPDSRGVRAIQHVARELEAPRERPRERHAGRRAEDGPREDLLVHLS